MAASTAQRFTHGTGQRPPRALQADVLAIDVRDLAADLQAEDSYATDGRASMTIHDDGRTSVIVTTVAAGREVGAERNSEHVMLTLAEGAGSLRRADDVVELQAGSAAIIAPGSPWTFVATADSAFTAAFWSTDPD